MQDYLYAFLFFPGPKELLLVTLLFLVLRKQKQLPWPAALTRSPQHSSTILGFVFIAINISGNPYPLMPFIYFFISFTMLMCMSTVKAQKLSLPIATALFALFHWQFSYVETRTEVLAKWIPREGDSIELFYGCNFDIVTSKDLSTDLTAMNTLHVRLVLRPIYHYGKVAGHSIESIDGKHYVTTMAGASGKRCEGEDEKWYPKFYFGLRGLNLRPH